MWSLGLAIALLEPAVAHLQDARPYGPVREVDVERGADLPVPAELLAWDDRIWRVGREGIVVQHRDGAVEMLPLTGARVWLGPPGFVNLHRRGTPDPRLVVTTKGREWVWDLYGGTLEPLVCGGAIAPYAFSPDCRALVDPGPPEQRLTPAKYSRLAVVGERLWVFGAGQLAVFDGSERQPRMPGPIVHLSHDAPGTPDPHVYVGVPTGIRAVFAETGEENWHVNRLVSWLAPSPTGDLVAAHADDDLLLFDRPTGRIVYAIEHVDQAAFAWTPEGDLVAVTPGHVVRFTTRPEKADRAVPLSAPPGRLPERLVQPGRLTLSVVDLPRNAKSIQVDGLPVSTARGVDGDRLDGLRVDVAPVDRLGLERSATLDIDVGFGGRRETVRVLRPEAGEGSDVTLQWWPLRIRLEDCAKDCERDLGPRLLGAEVAIDIEGEREDGSDGHWVRRAVHRGEAWTVAPL